MNEELKAKALALYQQGKSLSEIGKELFGGGRGAHLQARALLRGVIEEDENPAAPEKALAALAEALKSYLKPEASKLEVHITGRPAVQIDGAAHRRLKDVVRLVAAGEKNIFLVGPAGSGKTTLARQAAEALTLDFSFLSLSAGVSETHLFGRVLPGENGVWSFHGTPFLTIYENGGVFLFDEIDAAEPNLLVHLNSALANGAFSNPVNGKIYHRNKDCILLAAANTFGNGATAQYVGRNALDAATLDRFVMATIHCDYDRELERRIVDSYGLPKNTADEFLAFIDLVRVKIDSLKLRRICSTRTVEKGARLLAAGYTIEEVRSAYFAAWTKEEKDRVYA